MAKPDGPQVLVMLGTAGAAIVAGIGGAIEGGGQPLDNVRGWYVASAMIFGATVLFAAMFFVVHPAVAGLSARRTRLLANLPQPQAERATAMNAGIEIHEASYGAVGIGVDVSEIIRGRVVDGHLDMPVTNGEFGGDPYPNAVKTLTIQWSLDGRTMPAAHFTEGSRAVI